MADFISVEEVQQWLERTKLAVDEIDTELEDTAVTMVFSRTSRSFDQSAWVDANTTPALIRKIISLYVAAWTYHRAYAEATGESLNDYAVKLEAMADNLIAGLNNDTIDLTDVSTTIDEQTSAIVFVPSDTTGSSQQYDEAGASLAGGQYGEGIKFTMGSKF